MRNLHTAAVLTVLVTLLGACGQGTGSDDPGRAPTATPTSGGSGTTRAEAWTGERIPDGTYAKTTTMAGAERLELPEDVAADFLGRDGELHVELKLAGDRVAVFSDDGDAPMTEGEGGTTTYDEEGNWVITSTHAGCYGCVYTLGWSLKGDQLVLRLLDTTEVGDPVNLLIGRFVFEGRYAAR